MEGRVTDGHGRFPCDDVLNGQLVKVRFDWTDTTTGFARWEQAFSYVAGDSRATN